MWVGISVSVSMLPYLAALPDSIGSKVQPIPTEEKERLMKRFIKRLPMRKWCFRYFIHRIHRFLEREYVIAINKVEAACRSINCGRTPTQENCKVCYLKTLAENITFHFEMARIHRGVSALRMIDISIRKLTDPHILSEIRKRLKNWKK